MLNLLRAVRGTLLFFIEVGGFYRHISAYSRIECTPSVETNLHYDTYFMRTLHVRRFLLPTLTGTAYFKLSLILQQGQMQDEFLEPYGMSFLTIRLEFEPSEICFAHKRACTRSSPAVATPRARPNSARRNWLIPQHGKSSNQRCTAGAEFGLQSKRWWEQLLLWCSVVGRR